MSTIRRRLDDLQAARARQTQRKGTMTFVDDMRQWLQSIDGQAEIGTVPGENLHDEMVRRLQVAPGYDLSLMPGATLQDKHRNVELAHDGRIEVTPEARQAACKWFALWDGL